MTQHQAQRIAVKGADIDIAGKKCLDDAPRCSTRPDALTIEVTAALPIVWQEVMPEGIIAGMGILDRVSDAPVKGILDQEICRVRPNEKARGVDGPPGNRSLGGNGSCNRPWRVGRQRKGKSAHEGTGKIGARPQIGQWKRKGMIENIELYATFAGKPSEQLLPGGRRLWIDP